MCGSAEINGQAFCLGVLAMAELLQQRPDILGWVMPIVNAMTASTSSPSRAKLRPIAELVDMYHTRHATVNHDMLYALQGMSSDTFSDVGIILDYSRQWNQVLYSLVLFLLPRVQRLHVPHNTSCAGIIHAARMICKVTNVKSLASDVGYQVLEAESYESIRSNGPHQMWHIPNSATPVQADDFICLFEGALRPAVVRAQGDYFEIVIIAASWPRMDPSREPYRQRRQQVINEVEGFALLPFVWDWKPQVMVEKRNAHHRDLLRSVLDLDQLIDERYVSLAYLKKVWSISMEISPFLRPQDKELVNVEDAKNKAWNAYRTAHALPDISLDNSKGLHLVSWAVLNGCEQLAKDLVRDGADLNLVDYYGRTALSYAAECANVGLAHLLLANGARSIIDNPYRESPLSHAIDADHNKLAQLLLFLLDTPGELRTRWFLQAIRHGLIDLVHILILCGFDAKCGSQRLITCLPDMVASISADLSLDFSQLSRVELDRPEDYNDSPEHFCPLLTAIDSGSEGMVRLLVENGANAEESVPVERMRSKNVPPLIYAVDHGYVSMVQLLLSLGVETALGCPRGERLLHYAAAFPTVPTYLRPDELFAELNEGPSKAVEMARVLLDHGEDINKADEQGLTPVMIAVLKRRLHIMSFLIEEGADVNFQDKSKRTCLAHAIGIYGDESSWDQGIDLLLKHGAKFEPAG